MLRTAARVVVLITGILLVICIYFYTKDYTTYFRERKGTLVSVEQDVVGEDSVFQKSFVTLKSTEGLTVQCGLLVPGEKGRRYPAIVLMGGKATGKYAVDYAIGVEDVIIIAPDYPYEPKEKYTVMEFLGDVPEMRRALIDMVPSVMLLTDYLFQRGDVDTTKIVLLGYSFGAPLVPPIIANDRRAAVAAMVYGGGDLHSMIRHNVRRYEGPILSEFVAALGALLLRPLEPLRYAEKISPSPLIMINGSEDEQIPRQNTELLYEAALEPKKLIWLDSRHVNPRDVELTKRIVKSLMGELEAMGIVEGPQ